MCVYKYIFYLYKCVNMHMYMNIYIYMCTYVYTYDFSPNTSFSSYEVISCSYAMHRSKYLQWPLQICQKRPLHCMHITSI